MEDSLDKFEDGFEEKENDSTYQELNLQQSIEKESHLTKWMNAWRTIHGLEGHEEECKNVADGKILWKVVREVDDDQF